MDSAGAAGPPGGPRRPGLDGRPLVGHVPAARLLGGVSQHGADEGHEKRRADSLVAHVADHQGEPPPADEFEGVVEVAGHDPGRAEPRVDLPAVEGRQLVGQEAGLLDLAGDGQVTLVVVQARGGGHLGNRQRELPPLKAGGEPGAQQAGDEWRYDVVEPGVNTSLKGSDTFSLGIDDGRRRPSVVRKAFAEQGDSLWAELRRHEQHVGQHLRLGLARHLIGGRHDGLESAQPQGVAQL